MADISTQIKATISSKPELIADTPTVVKAFARTEKEQTDYRKWHTSTSAFKIQNWLREELNTSQTSLLRTHDGIDFFRNGGANGFRLHPALSPFSDAVVEHLFDYLKDQLVKTDYKVQSDTRIFERGYWQEKVHRHTFTPQVTEGGVFSQIVMELLYKDNHLCQLRMNAYISNTDLPHSTEEFARLFEAIVA
jgi:hypothetical protein